MTERPILFSAPMVRAILDGRKTQTRRVVIGRGSRAGPPEFHGGSFQRDDPSAWGWFFDGPDHNGYEVLARGLNERHDNGLVSMPCPYGVPGDRLWVRESIRRGEDENGGPIERVSSFFMADGTRTKADAWPWQRNVLPSIHCPRGLSRIMLEVTNIRVERLHDISEQDAIAEGVERVRGRDVSAAMGANVETWRDYEDAESWRTSATASFLTLWRNINGRDSWSANPWVWVVSFKRVTP